MRNGFPVALVLLIASAGLALGQVQLLPPVPGTGHLTAAANYQCPPPEQPMRVASWDPDVSNTPISYNDSPWNVVPCSNTDSAAGSRVWLRADYLLWWIKDGPLTVPLVTTGDPNDPIAAGALGRPGTQVLFGGNGLDYGTFSGLRLTAGGWLDADRRFGLEGSGFLLERRSVGFSAAGDAAGNPPLYLPVFRPDLGREGRLAIADPVQGFTGRIAIASQTRLWGAEANVLVNLWRENGVQFDFLAGYRHLDLTENLTLDPFLTTIATGDNLALHDQFRTQNQFNGGQVGGRVGLQFGRVSVDLLGKVALGSNNQVVDISGATVATGPGVVNPGPFAGGAFAQPSNIGRQSNSRFTVIPEGQVKVGFDILRNLHAYVGYDFLYWSQVVRPGSQIDRNVNPTQTVGNPLVGPAQPVPLFNRTDFWAQGVSCGLEFRY